MADELWAVTFLFGPADDTIRMANYRAFRRRLGCPLLAVEFASGGRFQLGPQDADMLVQFGNGDDMWQKERLFNIGVARLPAECRAVAMIDADIILSNADWRASALSALASTPAVQLFSKCVRLSPNQTPDMPPTAGHRSQSVAAIDAIRNGANIADCLVNPEKTAWQHLTWGGAWAYRRDLIARHGVYDAHILFGGDTAVAAACFGAMDALAQRHRLSAAHRAHYLAWADRWFADVQGRVGVLTGTAFHLWHGDMHGRYAPDWHEALNRVAFDPAKDLRDEPGQPWRWSGRNPGLEKLVTDYFAFRTREKP